MKFSQHKIGSVTIQQRLNSPLFPKRVFTVIIGGQEFNAYDFRKIKQFIKLKMA